MKISIPKSFLVNLYIGSTHGEFYIGDRRKLNTDKLIIWKYCNNEYTPGKLLKDWVKEDHGLVTFHRELSQLDLPYPDELEISGEVEEFFKNERERSITQFIDEINGILKSHSDWLNGDEMGTKGNFSELNLSGLDLSDCNLEYANLRKANLKGAILDGANLNNADLREVDFSLASMMNTLLNNTDLEKATFQEANLSGAKLCKANLKDTDFRNAKLHGANLYHATIQNTLITEFDLKDALIDLHSRNIIRETSRKLDINPKLERNKKYPKYEFIELIKKIQSENPVFSKYELKIFNEMCTNYNLHNYEEVNYRQLQKEIEAEIEEQYKLEVESGEMDASWDIPDLGEDNDYSWGDTIFWD